MWRETSENFLQVGRSLAVIEDAMRSVRASAVIDNDRAKQRIGEAYSASLKMVKALDHLRRQLSETE